VDTQSFPVELTSDPIYLMPQYGAYDANKIYTQDVIKGLVEHANFRGNFLLFGITFLQSE
jgi:hypothetical protein